MVMQNDGNMVLYDVNENAVWSSKTNGYANTFFENVYTYQFNGGYGGAFLGLSSGGTLGIYRMVNAGLLR